MMTALAGTLTRPAYLTCEHVRIKFMSLKRYALFLLTGIAVWVAIVVLRDSETEKILQLLENICTLAEVHAPESALDQARKANRIGQAFTEETSYDLTSAGYGIIEVRSRHELVQEILRGRATLASLELALDDPRVHLDGKLAHVELQGSATGSIRSAQGQFLDIHRMEILLEKTPDGWLVSGARHIRDERRQP